MQRQVPVSHPGARLAVAVLTGATLLGCGSPTPSSPAGSSSPPIIAGCVDLGDGIYGLSWSPGGQYLAVATWAGAGDPRAWLLAADGRVVGETLTVPTMVSSSLVVGPDGRRAWLTEGRANPGYTLVEDRLLGRRATPLSGPITTIGWTQLGYALVQRREFGDAVLLVDPGNPTNPVELHGTGGIIDRLWISADAKVMLLTSPANIGGAAFQIVDPTGSRDLAPAAADTSGASMIGAHVVYHAFGGEVLAVPVDDPTSVDVLSDRQSRFGMISDHGVLAMAASERVGLLCLEDVTSKVR